jgi:hypothetical protein
MDNDVIVTNVIILLQRVFIPNINIQNFDYQYFFRL